MLQYVVLLVSCVERVHLGWGGKVSVLSFVPPCVLISLPSPPAFLFLPSVFLHAFIHSLTLSSLCVCLCSVHP